MLRQLGLADDASAVYTALVHEPLLTLGDLVAHVRLPERTVRRILDQLADLHLVEQSATGDRRLVLIPPDQALPGLLAQAQADLKCREAALEQTRAEIAAMTHVRPDHGGAVIRLDGVEAVRDRLRQLSSTARSEVCSFSPGGAHRLDAMSESKPLNHELFRRQVVIRAIYQEAYRNDPGTTAYAAWLAEHGASLRTVPVVPMQLVLIDRAVAIIPISAAEPRVGGLEIRNLSIVAAISALFEQVWQNATPLGEQPPLRGDGLRPQEQQILRMLADGATDEVIARKMGVSVRTVRRAIADLTERLNATSRFQAGLNAGRAGWV